MLVCKLDTVAQTFNPSILEAGDLCELKAKLDYTVFQDSQGYI